MILWASKCIRNTARQKASISICESFEILKETFKIAIGRAIWLHDYGNSDNNNDDDDVMYVKWAQVASKIISVK